MFPGRSSTPFRQSMEQLEAMGVGCHLHALLHFLSDLDKPTTWLGRTVVECWSRSPSDEKGCQVLKSVAKCRIQCRMVHSLFVASWNIPEKWLCEIQTAVLPFCKKLSKLNLRVRPLKHCSTTADPQYAGTFLYRMIWTVRFEWHVLEHLVWVGNIWCQS